MDEGDNATLLEREDENSCGKILIPVGLCGYLVSLSSAIDGGQLEDILAFRT